MKKIFQKEKKSVRQKKAKQKKLKKTIKKCWRIKKVDVRVFTEFFFKKWFRLIFIEDVSVLFFVYLKLKSDGYKCTQKFLNRETLSRAFIRKQIKPIRSKFEVFSINSLALARWQRNTGYGLICVLVLASLPSCRKKQTSKFEM